MSKKATKKQVENTVKNATQEPNEKEVRANWLKQFANARNSASRCVTYSLTQGKGATIEEMKAI